MLKLGDELRTREAGFAQEHCSQALKDLFINRDGVIAEDCDVRGCFCPHSGAVKTSALKTQVKGRMRPEIGGKKISKPSIVVPSTLSCNTHT